MKLTLLLLIAVTGCRTNPLTFTCTTDSQCGAGGTCVNNACAFAGDCPSGLRFDKSAGSFAGQCVPVGDLAMLETVVDMALPVVLDMAAPIDMTPACAIGAQCFVGVGVCQRAGTITMCSPNPMCSAMPGAPDTSMPGWHYQADTSGSWDFNCNNIIEYQYPNGNTSPPDSSPVDCTTLLTQADCLATHWYYNGTKPCGSQINSELCTWQQDLTCQPMIGGTTTVQEGCK